MSAATLSKPCRCKLCGGRMAAGEPFRWRRFTFSKPGRRLIKVERFKPVHVGACPTERRAST